MVQFEVYFLLYHWLTNKIFAGRKPNRDKEVKNVLRLFKNKNHNGDYFKWTTWQGTT